MRRILFFIMILIIEASARHTGAQSVTLYTAGPAGLANNLAKSFTGKTGITVDVYQATSGDVLARLEAEKAKPRADVVVLASWGEGLTVRQRGLVDAYGSPEAKKLRPRWRDGGLAAQGGAALALIMNANEVKKGTAAAVMVRSCDTLLEGRGDHARPDALRQRRGVSCRLRASPRRQSVEAI